MGERAGTARDERVVAEVKRVSHAGLDGPALLRRTAGILGRAIPCEGVFASTVDPASTLMTRAIVERPVGHDGWIADAVNRYLDRVYVQSVVPSTFKLLAERRTVTTMTELAGGNPESYLAYNEIMRPLGLRHELYALFVDRGLWGTMGLIRGDGDPDFSPRELDLVRRVGPHIGAGLRAAALRAEATAATESAGTDAPGVLTIDAANRVVTATPAAERLLRELGPLTPGWRSGSDLPIALHAVAAVLGQALQPQAEQNRELVPRVRLRGASGRWLTLHGSLLEAAPDRPSERVVVIAPSRPDEIAWLNAAAHDLSPREEEVVKLVLRGRSTKQIADELFIAEHTVQRHLSNVFDKVGVRSRPALIKRLFVDHLLPTAA